jgi:hypothetical protein
MMMQVLPTSDPAANNSSNNNGDHEIILHNNTDDHDLLVIWQGIALLTADCMGVGILGLPNDIKSLGYVFGFIFLLGNFPINYYAGNLLSKLALDLEEHKEHHHSDNDNDGDDEIEMSKTSSKIITEIVPPPTNNYMSSPSSPSTSPTLTNRRRLRNPQAAKYIGVSQSHDDDDDQIDNDEHEENNNTDETMNGSNREQHNEDNGDGICEHTVNNNCRRENTNEDDRDDDHDSVPDETFQDEEVIDKKEEKGYDNSNNNNHAVNNNNTENDDEAITKDLINITKATFDPDATSATYIVKSIYYTNLFLVLGDYVLVMARSVSALFADRICIPTAGLIASILMFGLCQFRTMANLGRSVSLASLLALLIVLIQCLFHHRRGGNKNTVDEQVPEDGEVDDGTWGKMESLAGILFAVGSQKLFLNIRYELKDRKDANKVLAGSLSVYGFAYVMVILLAGPGMFQRTLPSLIAFF